MLRKSAAFPVGLYAMLLFALAWLTLPALFAPLERWLLGAATAAPRMASLFLGQPASAATHDDLARVSDLRDELQRRVERQDFAAEGVKTPAGAQKLLCGVLSATRRGGGGRMSELLLDHSYAELAGCDRVVIKGDQMVGFLMEPGRGRAVDDELSDPARVMLCNHRDAPRLYAGIEFEGDADSSALRFVVRSGSSVDPAPLRVDIWDDPYRAAHLNSYGMEVRTRALQFGAGRFAVPAGLLLGRARVWGYEAGQAEDDLTIGVYVDPPFEPSALSYVVLWRRQISSREGLSSIRAHQRAAATVYDLPGARWGRHLIVTRAHVSDHAAVVQGGLLVGLARGLRFGSGLMTSFPASRRRWSLLLLQDDASAAVVEMSGVVERADGNVAWVRCQGPSRARMSALGEGFLFTGSNGRFCPSGLLIGRVTPDRQRPELLMVMAPRAPGPYAAEVLVAAEEAR